MCVRGEKGVNRCDRKEQTQVLIQALLWKSPHISGVNVQDTFVKITSKDRTKTLYEIHEKKKQAPFEKKQKKKYIKLEMNS